ncbi:uncharacterized protein N7515_002861 [Penicillium bovifimosum]|uniref:Uncharacterized protein n=1 Tax=Penicillium bovifimosum TaxID=126998 RepID=A0A9W9LA22_9EURO|nr:uncharacterized protein N7515_002861 [Penicillium bovifimosum]KAJ5144074.1 hypothetical protein N7515_002861 [Penicillium bovifimosum]
MAPRQSKVQPLGTPRQGTQQPLTFNHASPQQHDAAWALWVYASGRPFSIIEDRGFIEALPEARAYIQTSLSAPALWPVTGSGIYGGGRERQQATPIHQIPEFDLR